MRENPEKSDDQHICAICHVQALRLYFKHCLQLNDYSKPPKDLLFLFFDISQKKHDGTIFRPTSYFFSLKMSCEDNKTSLSISRRAKDTPKRENIKDNKLEDHLQ